MWANHIEKEHRGTFVSDRDKHPHFCDTLFRHLVAAFIQSDLEYISLIAVAAKGIVLPKIKTMS